VFYGAHIAPNTFRLRTVLYLCYARCTLHYIPRVHLRFLIWVQLKATLFTAVAHGYLSSYSSVSAICAAEISPLLILLVICFVIVTTGRPPLRAPPGAAGQLGHHAGPQHDHALQQQGAGDPPGTYDTYVNTLFTIDAEGFCVGAMCRKYCVLRWPDCVGGYDAVIIPTPPRKPFVVFIVLSLRLTLFFICTQLSRRVPRR
jgi:hypothetical protein